MNVIVESASADRYMDSPTNEYLSGCIERHMVIENKRVKLLYKVVVKADYNLRAFSSHVFFTSLLGEVCGVGIKLPQLGIEVLNAPSSKLTINRRAVHPQPLGNIYDGHFLNIPTLN